jgi:methylenetetrahydrofolate reductase (NADPH)
MKITEYYKNGKQALSFEVFTPKKDAGEVQLYAALDGAAALKPDFISVTYGATDSGKTADIARAVQSRHNITALAHVTCAGAARQEITNILAGLEERGVENVLALYGDTAAGRAKDYVRAHELIKHIKDEHPSFAVGAAAYPEGHIDCAEMYESITHMRIKQDAGTDFFLTQLFFDNDIFYRFRDASRACGITKPVSAGVMPILSRRQIEKMIFMCGASLPSRIIKLLHRYRHDEISLRKAGIEYAAVQARELLRNGVDGIHIYTMNRPEIAGIIAGYVGARDFK